MIHSGPAIEGEDPRATFTFSAGQPGVDFACSLDGREPAPCTSPYTISRVGLGEHTFEVTATHPLVLDAFGEPLDLLYEPITATYDWSVVDHTPPDTVVQYGPPATTSSLSAYFGFSSSDPTAIVECSLDFGGFSECESPHVVEDLLPGDHVMHVRAVDPAGNADTTPAVHRWTVAHPAPNTPVGSNRTVSLPMRPEDPVTTAMDMRDRQENQVKSGRSADSSAPSTQLSMCPVSIWTPSWSSAERTAAIWLRMSTQ